MNSKTRLFIMVIILILMAIICLVLDKSLNEAEENKSNNNAEQLTSKEIVEGPTAASTLKNDVVKVEEPSYAFSKNWDKYETYLLAKIAMAEAEGEDIKGKALVICTVLNRVFSEDFPDNIHDVIFQNEGNTYQFSPMIPGGRWYTVEPSEECYKAVEMVQKGWDESEGALYFTSQKGNNTWHDRTFDFLFKHGGHKFYK